MWEEDKNTPVENNLTSRSECELTSWGTSSGF